MKLATKISLLAVTIALLLSQLFNYQQLYRSRQWMIRQTIDAYVELYADFYQTYKNNIDYMVNRYEKEMDYLGGQETGENWLRFRQAYMEFYFQDTHAALYQEGEEIINLTEYDFQLMQLQGTGWLSGPDLQEICDDMGCGEEWLQWVDVAPVEDGKQLLVFLGNLPVDGENFHVFYCADITRMFQSSREVFLAGLEIALAVSAITALLLYLAVRWLLRPLHHLQKAADSIADGNYQQRIPAARRDEVGRIAENFNRMAQHIQEHVDSLNQAAHSQQRMIDAQKQLIGALAHELKTPMTALIGAAQTLKNVKVTPEQSERLFSYMESECMRLSRLSLKMQDLVGLYYMEEQGGLELNPVRVGNYLEKVYQLALPSLEQNGIFLKLEMKEEAGEAFIKIMDEDLAISFLLNLIDNARKAYLGGGNNTEKVSLKDRSIIVTASRQELCVADQGRGIPAEEIERITEAFYMVDKSRSRAAGGIGLGLTLCQQIAQLHGWRLEIRSVEGEGTEVVVGW